MSVFPYFFSYLQIVQGQSVTTAGYITRVFTFSSTVSSIVVSLIIKYTAHYKYYVTFGSLIYLMGMGLMLAYRTENASTGTLVGTQIAIGIGGGSIVGNNESKVTVGRHSVGYAIKERALVFGGSTMTATDIAVAIGANTTIGDASNPESLESKSVSVKYLTTTK